MAQIQPSEKQFWKYVLPSMLTMLLGGFYGIVDGFFIGNAVGDDGLAAINLAWPLTALDPWPQGRAWAWVAQCSCPSAMVRAVHKRPIRPKAVHCCLFATVSSSSRCFFL